MLSTQTDIKQRRLIVQHPIDVMEMEPRKGECVLAWYTPQQRWVILWCLGREVIPELGRRDPHDSLQWSESLPAYAHTMVEERHVTHWMPMPAAP